MKIKRFDISIDAIKLLLGPGRHDREVSTNAIPEDAELVRIFVDENESTPSMISLFFTSESFPDVDEGTFLCGEHILFTEYYHEDQA